MNQTNEAIATLEARVAALEARLEALTARTDAVMPNKNHLRTAVLEAQRIELKSPDGQSQRVSMCGHETGAWITLFDGEGRARIIISTDDGREASAGEDGEEDEEAEESEYSIQFFGLDKAGQRQTALRLGLNDDNGAVEVHSSTGHPAALMKGMGENGGVVSVVNAEGEVCASLHRSSGGGRLDLLRDGLQKSVALQAGSEGGILTLSRVGEEPRVVLTSGGERAVLLLNCNESNEGCGVRLAANDKVATIRAIDKASSHAAMLSVIAGHSFLDIESGPLGKRERAFQVLSSEHLNTVEMMRPDGSAGLLFNVTAENAMISGTDTQENTRFMLVGADRQAGISVSGPDGTQCRARLTADENAALIIDGAEKPSVLIDGSPAGGRVVVLGGDATVTRQVALGARADIAGMNISKFGGDNTASLWSDEQGSHITLANPQETPVVHLHANEDGGTLGVTSETGGPRAAMSVVEDEGQLAIFASGGAPVVLINCEDESGQLTLFDEEGDRALTLPDDAHGL